MTTNATESADNIRITGPIPIILTDDPVPAEAAAVRAAFERADLDADAVTDEFLETLRSQAAVATRMLRDDPILAYQVVADPATAAQRLGLPAIPATRVSPSMDMPIQASYRAASADADVDELLGRLLEQAASDPAFTGAWRTDPVATLLAHAAGTPPGVVADAIRRVLQGGGQPTWIESTLAALSNAPGNETVMPDGGDNNETAER
jgi:hypothetical protein